jgi:hypothetical protein
MNHEDKVKLAAIFPLESLNIPACGRWLIERREGAMEYHLTAPQVHLG